MATTRKSRRSTGPVKQTVTSETGALQEEIAMLRTFIRMVENLADEGKPLSELLKILDMLGKSSTRLAGLLRAQRDLCEENEFGAVFDQALSEVMRELGAADAAGNK